MKACVMLIALLALTAASVAGTIPSAWPDVPALIKALRLTEERPGYFTIESGGIIIRCDTNNDEIYFASCADMTTDGSDIEDMTRRSQRLAEFFKYALPTWSGADLAFTQMWTVMESSQQKEMTIPFNDVVIHPDAYIEGCRTLTIKKR